MKRLYHRLKQHATIGSHFSSSCQDVIEWLKIDQASAMASREHYHSNAKADSWSSDALRMRFESCKSTSTKVTFVIYLSFNATNISRIKRTNVPVFCKSLRPSFRYGNEKVLSIPIATVSGWLHTGRSLPNAMCHLSHQNKFKTAYNDGLWYIYLCRL